MLTPSAEGVCKVCKEPFVKFRTLQTICGKLRCAKQVGKLARKAERESVKKRKEAAKKRSDWMREAQDAFNGYIRKRDRELACISCGRYHRGQYHAGHYLSLGSRPELRFDEDNVHRQCQPCNTHLHGNLVLYRMALLDRIGDERLARLEGPHPARKYTIEDLKQIRATYRRKAKEIEDVH